MMTTLTKQFISFYIRSKNNPPSGRVQHMFRRRVTFLVGESLDGVKNYNSMYCNPNLPKQHGKWQITHHGCIKRPSLDRRYVSKDNVWPR